MTTTYPNKFDGPCADCGQTVPAMAGERIRLNAGGWITIHAGHRCPTPTPDSQLAQGAAPGYVRQPEPAPAAPTFQPTAEQERVRELFATGKALVIEAGAGAGKTSTLLLLAADAAKAGRRGQYVAYNKAIVKDAAAKMPGNVRANTMHSLAFAAVGKNYKHRINSTRMRGDQLARNLRIDPFIITYGQERTILQPSRLAGVVMKAMSNFCASTDTEPGEQHVPYVDGIDVPDSTGDRTWDNNRQLRRHLVPALRRAWADQVDPNGQLPYKPDSYLKLWAMSDPQIDADFILFDEAQDADPVQLQIVFNQKRAQLVVVGDSQQAIYGWRGAVDALAKVREPGGNVAYLTQSFRFGPAVAEVANGILGRLGAELRIVGTDQIDSQVLEVAEPDAILCRSNAQAVTSALSHMADGRRVALVGGAAEVVAFARAAQKLQDGETTDHKDLGCFTSWDQVLEYVAFDEQGDELRLLVTLVKDFTAEKIIAGLGETVPEGAPGRDGTLPLVISTAHKAKGREWDAVQLAADFKAPKDGGELPAEELRLIYVAVTRARRELDVSLAPIAMAAPEADGQPQTPPAATDEPTGPAAAPAAPSAGSALDLTARYGTGRPTSA